MIQTPRASVPHRKTNNPAPHPAVDRALFSLGKTAFTLIELLVVTAIIALLAAILFPVFAQVWEKARQTACITNLRQVGNAFMAYTQDYDGGYPNTGDPYLFNGKRWRWCIMPYLGIGQKEGTSYSSIGGPTSILLCPADTLSGTGYDATSYNYSAAFYHTPTINNSLTIANLRSALNAPGMGAQCETQTESDVRTPAQKHLLGEWFTSHQHTETRFPVGYWGTLDSATNTPGTDCRTGARLYVFADGHTLFYLQASKKRHPETIHRILIAPRTVFLALICAKKQSSFPHARCLPFAFWYNSTRR